MSNDLHILLDVALAMLLGGIVGLERELAQKPAGLRTHMLVCGAAALLVGIVDTLIAHVSVAPGSLRADPIRIIEAVITGISFLGAGTIIRQRDGTSVEGLTTAAGLLFAAVIGICVGSDALVVAIGGTVLALFTLGAVGLIERLTDRRSRED